MSEAREGETRLAFDPGELPGDGRIVFIGHIASPWKSRDECPKNMVAARETGRPARLRIDEPYRPGLEGLAGASHVVILSWLPTQRDLIVQKPRHAEMAKGVFALRSPARPNPIGLHVAKVLFLDPGNGTIDLDAIDVLDGTPVLDLKPYIATIDAFPDATRAKP
jgi:tRNA-Thr(GGU) m(6)t(6)A37 methyltransferase TsaA